MSNINKNSYPTKLRSSEMSKCHSRNQSNINSCSQMDSVASGSSCNSNVKNKNTDQQTEIISEPHRPKCGGRGLAIQQLCESMKSSKISLMKPKPYMDFSNISIERHFKKLREENLKKLTEESEKAYEELIFSAKKT